MGRKKARTDMEIFLSHVTPGEIDDCWIWQGCKWGKDYGSGWLNGRKQGAHCVSYQLFVGDIPDGLEVMHSCNTPMCVNPKHLSLGTHAQNMAQTTGRRKAMSPARGTRHGLAKLTDEKAEQARRLSQQGLSFKRIGALLGVSGTSIRNVVRGVTWTHVRNEGGHAR